MPITVAFTIAAAVAVLLHLRKLRLHYLNRRAVLATPSTTPAERRTSGLLLEQSIVRTGVNFLLIISGGGVLIGHRQFGYALVLIPVLTSIATFFDPA